MKATINDNTLKMVTGGETVSGTKNYLALRSDTSYSDKSIIGKLHNGEYVKLQGKTFHNNGHDFAYVYSPKLGCSGYVISSHIS